ncbi:MAG: AI-2E family transporter [Nanoarchaeota archaeon]
MALNNQEIRRFAAIAFILLVFVSAFFIIRPLFLSIVGGLLLAYVFFPLHKLILKIFRERNTAALATCILIVVIIFIPFWFLIPLMVQQLFDLFNASQQLDVAGLVERVLPSFSEQIKRDLTSAIINFVSKSISSVISLLTTFILDLPIYLLYFAVIIFVFFFSLRDADKLRDYVTGLSPLKRDKEKHLAHQFREITSSIIFGYVIVGLIQGIATGIGLLIFGVPKALLLTVFALFASIIPMVGPALVWLPSSIYLLSVGKVSAGIAFMIYGAIFISTIDNFIRPYLISRRTNIPPVIVLIGMIGGLLVFGFLGLIIGPLILAYLLTLLEAYKNKTLAEMFTSD